MADKTKSKDKSGGASERVREGADRLRDAGKAVAENSGVVGLKMIDQAEENAKSAFSAMRDAAQAKDVGEVMKIQGEFLRQQGERSVNQAREIGELIAEFGRDAVSSMRGDK
ncbi:MAG: phasin family protein [Sphingomonadaceae bacterium]|nr:phasin family protein [Sphingomonadaceae bacterium]